MIDKVRIQNFRCFSSLEVSGLKRINVIVGRNSSGKSAFLESVFISSSATAPQVAFQMRNMRQLGQKIEVNSDASSYQGLWEDLFFGFNQDRPISIEIMGTAGDSRSLQISYDMSADQVLPFGKQPVGTGFRPQISFEWRRGSDVPVISKPKITNAGLVFEGMAIEHFPVIFFSPHNPESPEENAKRFSELSKSNRLEPIIHGLNSEFPFLENLSIEYNSGTPTVFAKVKHGARKMPMGLLSDGVNKLLGILLGIAIYRDGTILIDQLEDGFYWDRLPDIWKLLYGFAVTNNVQIFATTHSQECLQALLPTMKEHEDDFGLLRAERENGFSTVTHTKGKFLEAALQHNFEVR